MNLPWSAFAFSLALAACGDGHPAADGDGGGGSADAAPACTAIAPAPVVGLDQLLDLAVDPDGALVLGVGADGLALVRPSGERIALDAAGADYASLATRPDGTLCATWHRKAVTKTFYACGPDFVAADTGLTSEMAGSLYLAEVSNDTSAMFFQGGFYSASAAIRSGTSWSEEELFESSESSFGGALAVGGRPFACMIGSGHDVALMGDSDFGGLDRLASDPSTAGALAGPVPACAIAAANDRIYVLFGKTGGDPAMYLGQWDGSTWTSAAVDLPITTREYGFAAGDTLRVVYPQGDALVLAEQGATGWTSAPVAGLAATSGYGRPLLRQVGGALHLAARGPDGIQYARRCVE